MWRKMYEVRDGHQTGRWQWGFYESPGTPAIDVYPKHWMFADTICPPPDCGQVVKSKRRGDNAPIFVQDDYEDDDRD